MCETGAAQAWIPSNWVVDTTIKWRRWKYRLKEDPISRGGEFSGENSSKKRGRYLIHHRLMCRLLTILILTRRILIEAAIGMMSLISSLGLFLFDLLNLLVGCTRVSRCKNNPRFFHLFTLSWDPPLVRFRDSGFPRQWTRSSIEDTSSIARKLQTSNWSNIYESFAERSRDLRRFLYRHDFSTIHKKIELNYCYF